MSHCIESEFFTAEPRSPARSILELVGRDSNAKLVVLGRTLVLCMRGSDPGRLYLHLCFYSAAEYWPQVT